MTLELSHRQQSAGSNTQAPTDGAIVGEILSLTSSLRGSASYSNKIGAQVLGALQRAHPGAAVTARDLSHDPLPHIDADFAAGISVPDAQRTPSQRDAVARSDALIDELVRADVIVIAVPMINFTIPSTLKAWLDHVTRRGRTFAYGESGPKGLVTGKRVILVQAKGGRYSGAMQANDFVAPYLKHMLGFLGMTDLQVIDVEGTNLGPEAAESAVAHGMKCAEAVVKPMAAG
jgi:FMN-dependent NADH-azoreductase